MTMPRSILAAALAAAALVTTLAAQTGALDKAAAALGVDRIDSLTFEAAGRYYQFGLTARF